MPTDQIVTCQVGDLPPGFTTTPDITLDATVIASDPARTHPWDRDRRLADAGQQRGERLRTAIITVITSADLAMTKKRPLRLVAGGVATYTLTGHEPRPVGRGDV